MRREHRPDEEEEEFNEDNLFGIIDEVEEEEEFEEDLFEDEDEVDKKIDDLTFRDLQDDDDDDDDENEEVLR